MFPEKNTFFLQKSSFDLTLTHSEISLKISAVDLWNGNLMIRKIGVSNFICFVELEKRSIEMGWYGSYLENHNFGQRKAIQRRLEISGYGSALPDKPLMLDEWIRGLPSRKCEHVSAIWSAPLKIGQTQTATYLDGRIYLYTPPRCVSIICVPYLRICNLYSHPNSYICR